MFIFNDGGRADASYQGTAGDCTVRAIAIATGKPYQEVYDALFELNKSQKGKLRGASPRDGGTKTATIRKYMKSIGWRWTPTMTIGSGCQVHLKAEELPLGRLVVRVSKHMVAVIDRVINDLSDCSRDGTRCVYGYYHDGFRTQIKDK
jgi:hypothetical protein